MVAISVWIKLDSHGPILFRQRRVGLHGRTFDVRQVPHHGRGCGGGAFEGLARAERDPGQRLQDGDRPAGDPPRGSGCARLSPRRAAPAVQRPARRDEPRRSEATVAVRGRRATTSGTGVACPCGPGMTGLWQVTARRKHNSDSWVETDLEYIDSWSIWLDLAGSSSGRSRPSWAGRAIESVGLYAPGSVQVAADTAVVMATHDGARSWPGRSNRSLPSRVSSRPSS